SAFAYHPTGPDFPQDWPAVVMKVLDNLPTMPQIPKPLPNVLQDALTKIQNQLRNSPSGARLYDEFKRDFSATVYGRRDALWSLTRALGAARELIYIEGPAFSATGYGSPVSPIALVSTIVDRLKTVSSLRVVVCLSRELDYGPGYETVAAREYAQRLAAIARLQDAASERVVAFHPVG